MPMLELLMALTLTVPAGGDCNCKCQLENARTELLELQQSYDARLAETQAELDTVTEDHDRLFQATMESEQRARDSQRRLDEIVRVLVYGSDADILALQQQLSEAVKAAQEAGD